MTSSGGSNAGTHHWRFLAVVVVAMGLAFATKAILPGPAGTEYTAQWTTVVGNAVSTIILVIGYGLGITYLLNRGGYRV